MHVRRQTYIHQVYLPIGEQLVQCFVAAYSRQVLHSPAIAEITLNIVPIPSALFGVAGDDGRNLAPLDLGHSLVVGHAHKTDADNADIDHYFLLVWNR